MSDYKSGSRDPSCGRMRGQPYSGEIERLQDQVGVGLSGIKKLLELGD